MDWLHLMLDMVLCTMWQYSVAQRLLSCGDMLCSLLAHSLSGSEDRQQVPVVNSLSTQHGVPEEDGSLRSDHHENLKAHMEMNLRLPRPSSAVLQGNYFEASNGVTASSSQVQYSTPIRAPTCPLQVERHAHNDVTTISLQEQYSAPNGVSHFLTSRMQCP
jgi:hypothetical protein